MTAARIALAALTLVIGGCGADGLRFRADDRLRFVSPPERSVIEGPVLVRWAIDPSQFRAVGADGSSDARRGFFAVFVDRAPMRPGEGVHAVAEDDPYCRPEVGCPDRDWLERHGIHLTTQRRLALPRLPREGSQDLGDLERHEITVVLLDGRGVRIGESGWSLTLFSRGDEA